MMKKTTSLIGATLVATGLLTAVATTAAHAAPDGCYTASLTSTTIKVRCASGYGTFQIATRCMDYGGYDGYSQWGNVATRTSASPNAASAVTCAVGYVVDSRYYVRRGN